MSQGRTVEVQSPFPLLDDVIVLADAAMRARDRAGVVAKLVKGLEGLLSNPLDLPEALLAGQSDEQLRRLLYRSREYGYEVIAITWAPGQGSMVHDHADTWGVEAVLRGRLEVVDYRVAARHRALSELHPVGCRTLDAGTVIDLLPPHDLHSCRNAGARETAVSLHVYGKHLEHVKRYTHVEGALYRPQRVMFGLV